VRDTTKLWGGSEIAVAVWKVPRHCPLVLLIGWDLTLAERPPLEAVTQ
jgi:hypothetical protein